MEMSKVITNGGLVYVSVRSDSTPPRNGDKLEGERETYRFRDEGGIVRCYFSELWIADFFRDGFDILELEEKELITRIGKEPYKMRILVMRRQ